MKLDDCPFCDPDRFKDDIVFEDEICKVVRDRTPKAPIHWLVIPKQHHWDLANCSEQTLTHLFTVIARVVFPQLKKPYHVLINGEQSVAHLHIHILAGEEFGLLPRSQFTDEQKAYEYKV